MALYSRKQARQPQGAVKVDNQFQNNVSEVKWLSFVDALGVSKNIADDTILPYTSTSDVDQEGNVAVFNGSQQGRVLLPSLSTEGKGSIHRHAVVKCNQCFWCVR